MAVDQVIMDSTGIRAREECRTCGLAHTSGIPDHAPHPHAGLARFYAWPTEDGAVDSVFDFETEGQVSRSEAVRLLTNRLRAKLERPDPEMESRSGSGGCVIVPTGRTVLERSVSVMSLIVSADGQVHGPGHVQSDGPTTTLGRLIQASLEVLTRDVR